MNNTSDTLEHMANGNTKKKPFASDGEKKRCRSWFITINTWHTKDLDFLKSIKNTKLIAFQTEVGKKNNRKHLHAVISFINAVSFNTIKDWFPRANIQTVRNLQKAVEYCQKRDTFDGIRFLKKNNTVLTNLSEDSHQSSPSDQSQGGDWKKAKKKIDEKDLILLCKKWFEINHDLFIEFCEANPNAFPINTW